MFNYNVKNGIAEYLNAEEEEKLLEIICEHIKKYDLIICQFIICGDHIHFIIYEEPSNLNSTVGRLKSISARELNIWRGLTIIDKPDNNLGQPLGNITKFRGETQNSLWSQKFNRVEIIGVFQMQKTILYIKKNRVKHQMKPLSEKANRIIKSIISEKNIQF